MTLTALRRQVDATDARLAALLIRRASLSRRIGEAKRRNGAAIHDGRREQAVLAHVASLSQPPLTAQDLKRIFRVIMGVSRRLQKGRPKAR